MSELDDQRETLADELENYIRAGGLPEEVVDAIEALIDAKIEQRQRLPLPQQATHQ